MRGYVSEAVRLPVREAAQDRCGYCLSHQRYVLGPLEVEHLVPLSAGGADAEDNLWLACARCNRFKGAQREATDPLTGETHPLFNPRLQRWGEHFRWALGGERVEGVSALGRATVEALRMNHEHTLAIRRNWILAGWHPPDDASR